jgi:zinc protease
MNMHFRAFGLALLLCFAAALPAKAAFKIQRVVSPGGIEAWLVEDHRVPVMALDLSFRGGSSLDPKGKEGLAMLSASLLDEGAGDLNSTAFQKELGDKSIGLSFGADFDGVSGQLKTLTQFRDRAFEMLAMALEKPRLDPEPLERMRNEMVVSIATNLGNPNWIARRKMTETLLAGHPYSRPSNGTVPSVRSITVGDVRKFLKDRFGRDQMLITAAGDITPDELSALLDKTFARLPAKAAPFSVPEAAPKDVGDTITIQRGIPQTVISIGAPGMKRNDPDWYAGQIVNYVLGGGGFQSRLMDAVRGAGAKKGLSYGFSSAFVPYQHGGVVVAGGSTRNATAAETLGVVKSVFGKMHDDGVTEAEMNDAKTYLTGSFPLTLTSTDRLAALLMQLREQDLGIDYLDRRDALINGVTLADAKRVSARLLDPAKLTIVMVGQPEGFDKPAAPVSAN